MNFSFSFATNSNTSSIMINLFSSCLGFDGSFYHFKLQLLSPSSPSSLSPPGPSSTSSGASWPLGHLIKSFASANLGCRAAGQPSWEPAAACLHLHHLYLHMRFLYLYLHVWICIFVYIFKLSTEPAPAYLHLFAFASKLGSRSLDSLTLAYQAGPRSLDFLTKKHGL